ncbi:hypothetical protein ACHAW6_009177 [Cyclotella cf. meneghiniana]
MKNIRACAECHRAKCKCHFSQETSSKCDRCTRLNRECVPHLSRQGKREKKGKEKNVADVAAFRVTTSTVPLAYSVNGVMATGAEGCNAGTSQDQLIQMSFGSYFIGEGNSPFTLSEPGQLQISSQSQIVPSSPTPDENDGPLDSFHLFHSGVPNFHETRPLRPPAAANITVERTALNIQQQTTRTSNHCIENMCNTTLQGETADKHSFSSTTIPLRQWISRARGFDENNRILPQYISSCLHIALSLSKSISGAEELPFHKLRSLPMDFVNWAEFVTVKLKEKDINNISAHDDPLSAQDANDDLALLEVWLDKICEAEQIDIPTFDNSCIYNVDSADFFTDSTELVEESTDFLSSQDERWQIYALGLVLYELFSGGILPPPEFLPSPSFRDPGVTPASYGTLNLSDLVLSKLDDNDEGNTMHRGRRRPLNEPQAQLNSVTESLKAIGISYRLCDLLFNMLDCINGNLSGSDAYVKMSDITSDLLLMNDKPSKFLHDPDTSTISSAGLQVKDMSIVRDSEFASLQDAYRRSSEGSSEFAIIAGGSGTGKSYLAFRLGRHITDCGGIFLSVKFDPVAQANPFSALVLALNEYCTIFTAMKDSDWIKSIATKLRDALGQDANYLIKIIPKLSEILDHDATYDALDHECVNGHKKIHYLLIRFVEVMSACSQVPMTLLLDDLQWADAFSLSVLEQIMKMPESDNRFFFIGCYRDDEMEDSHPFKKILGSLTAYGIRLTMVHLDCLDKDTVNRMVSELLCLSPRLVNSLSDIIYAKTKGNALFLSRLLVSLNRDGLLHFSLRRLRWVWEEEQIQLRKLPDDVASFFSDSIRGLSPQVQTALQVLSCFGSVETCELSILESNLSFELLHPLELAVDEGFVVKKDQQFRFSHDKILQAAYEMAQLDDRRLQHLQYGICLLRVLKAEDGTGMLITAIGQINLAGPSVVTDPTLSIEFAGHNLNACKKAMEMSEYTAAAIYAKHGISFLKKQDHWGVHYRLSLELYELATKCMLLLGDFNNLEVLSEQVVENARSLEDKLDTLFTVMTSLSYASKMSDSIDMGLSILCQLGHGLPTTFTLKDTVSLIKQTHKNLDIPDHVLLTYRKMSDTRHLMAMKCLAKLELTTSMANPLLQPIVTLKMVRLTIDHGLSSMSPIGFAYFAGLLLKHDDMKAGFRFARLAMQMLDRIGSKEATGSVIFNSTQVLSFQSPFASVNEYRLHGQDAAMAAGDLPFACGLKLSYCVALFWSGSNLEALKDIYARSGRYMKGQNNLTSYNLLLLSYHGLLTLVGETDEDQSLTEDQLTNPLQRLFFYFQHMFASFILNDYYDMKYYAEKFFECREAFECKLSIWYAMHEFYGGLVSFRIYRESKRDTSWLEKGKQSTSAVRLWAEQGSSWNFEQKLYLLEAEEQFCNGNFLGAQESYSSAVSSARSHKFINDEALAYELAGYFYLKVGMSVASMQHFARANAKYMEWGASLKVNKIFDFVQEKFGKNSLPPGDITLDCYHEDQDSRKRRVP